MLVKISELNANLANVGFLQRPGKGNHTVWEHPGFKDIKVTIAGTDGDDARKYQIRLANNALRRVGGDA